MAESQVSLQARKMCLEMMMKKRSEYWLASVMGRKKLWWREILQAGEGANLLQTWQPRPGKANGQSQVTGRS